MSARNEAPQYTMFFRSYLSLQGLQVVESNTHLDANKRIIQIMNWSRIKET